MIVVYILGLNLLIALLYFLVTMVKKDYKKALLMSAFIILAPLVGPLYLFIAWLSHQLYFKHKSQLVNVDQLSYSKERVKVMEKESVQAALNKVPLEEALLVSSVKDTRKLLLDILKDDSKNYASSIYKATDHRDREVSHYAATAVTDIMARFKKEEEILREDYLNNKNNMDAINSYWTYTSEFLGSKILSQVEQERYVSLLENLLVDLEKNKPDKVRANSYYSLVLLYIDLGKMEKAGYWFSQALDKRPDSLDSYKAGFRYYYAENNGPKLLMLIRQLKETNIHIDNETLEFIRFYDQ